MKMMRYIAGLICVCTLFAFPSCNKSPVPVVLGNWVRIGTAQFKGAPRSGAYCFTIGKITYVGLGYGPNRTLHCSCTLMIPIPSMQAKVIGTSWRIFLVNFARKQYRLVLVVKGMSVQAITGT